MKARDRQAEAFYYVGESAPETPEEIFERNEMRGEVLRAVYRLPDREKVAVMLREIHEVQLDFVGIALGVTKERARQITLRGIRMLRKRTRANRRLHDLAS